MGLRVGTIGDDEKASQGDWSHGDRWISNSWSIAIIHWQGAAAVSGWCWVMLSKHCKQFSANIHSHFFLMNLLWPHVCPFQVCFLWTFFHWHECLPRVTFKVAIVQPAVPCLNWTKIYNSLCSDKCRLYLFGLGAKKPDRTIGSVCVWQPQWESPLYSLQRVLTRPCQEESYCCVHTWLQKLNFRFAHSSICSRSACALLQPEHRNKTLWFIEPITTQHHRLVSRSRVLFQYMYTAA